jgi:S1-C subfamily serine protease
MNQSIDPSPEKKHGWLYRFRDGVLRGLPFLAGMLAAFLGLVVYNVLYPGPHAITIADVNAAAAKVMASATPAPPFSVGVYQAIQPSLVLIQTNLPGSASQDEKGLGSGVVIDDSGDILTALHVVADATAIKVTFFDGTQSDAMVTNSQPQNDIAVLKTSNLPAQLVPATLGNPNSLQVGDEAYVVGNPFGLYSSMSAGVISAFNRSFESPNSKQVMQGLIQVDAAINPGNSGGPLLDRYGAVVGIVEGIVNPTGQDVFVGIGFAVPIDVAGGAVGSPPD